MCGSSVLAVYSSLKTDWHMGERRAPTPKISPGTMVRIADREALEAFRRGWHWHHPLESAQLLFAGHETRVKNVFFYHGGDELYELDNVPGIWHEQCLKDASEQQ
jgi:hypothetical protein